MEQHFPNDFFNEIVFFLDNLGFVVLVQHLRQVHRTALPDFLVPLQKLNSVPPLVHQFGIEGLQGRFHLVNPILDGIRIHHGVFLVVQHMAAHGLVVVDQGVRGLGVLMVGRCVQQYVQAPTLPGRNGNYRNAQHFRQPVQVDFHAPLFYNIHHIQGHHHGLAQFQQLKGQVQAPLQGRGIHHIDDHVHFIAEDKVPGNDFFHGIGGQAVGPRQVHQPDVHVVVADGALHLLYGYPGPVGHL